MRRAQLLVVALVVLGVGSMTATSSAQDLKDPAFPKGPEFHLELAGSAELRSGNVNYTGVSDQALARYTKGLHDVSLRTSHAFAKMGSDRFLNAFRGLMQYRLGWDLGMPGLDRAGAAAVLHYDRDEFRRREHLLNLGAGAFVDLFNGEKLFWNVTVAPVFEFEKFAVLTDENNPSVKVADSGYELNAWRAWIGSELSWQFYERFHVGEDLVIQVPLDHCPCDPRVYTTSDLRVYGNDYVALQTALTVIYDAGPPRFGGIKSFDAIIRSSLVFSL